MLKINQNLQEVSQVMLLIIICIMQELRRNSLVHVSKYSFNVGDFDIIKKDFDNNTEKKRKI